MVHTIEIQDTITRIKLINSKDNLTWFNQTELDSLIKNQLRFIKSNRIPIPGIKQIEIKRVGCSDFFKVSVQVNLESLYTCRPEVGLFDCDSSKLRVCSSRFDSIMEVLFPHLNPFPSWQLIRIDYAHDFYTSRVNAYISLAKKANIPRGFKVIDDYIGSYYIMCKSLTIGHYNKYLQMLDKWNIANDDTILDKAKNILRYEVQCRGSKIRRIRESMNLLECRPNLYHFLNEDTARNTLASHYDKTIGSGDYYSIRRANEKILKSTLTDLEKIKLIKLIELIASSNNLSEARLKFIKRGSKITSGTPETFKTHLGLLAIIGVNPITIPNDLYLEYLPNLWYKDKKSNYNSEFVEAILSD